MRALPAITLLAGLAAGVLLASVPALRERWPTQTNASAAEPAKTEEGHHDDDLVHLTPAQITQQRIGVAEAGPGTLPHTLTAYGAVAAASDRVARVPARVVGTVAELRKRLGDRVEKSEVVAILDSREVADAKGEYLTAAVNAELQQTNFTRAQNLREKGVAPESQYLQVRATNAETALRLALARQKLSALGLDAGAVTTAAKADAEAATSSLRRYELRAPMSGQVIDRRVDVGAAVGKEGDPSDLYTIADLSTVWIELAVPTGDLDALKIGATVTLAGERSSASPPGRVIFVSPVLNPDTRAARVIAELPNADGQWRPGAFVRATVDLGCAPAAVMVRRAAVHTVAGKAVVFVRDAEGFRRRAVTLGRTTDVGVEIVSGLADGDVVAVENAFLLKAELGKAGAAHDH